MRLFRTYSTVLFLAVLSGSCKKKIQQQEDEIYSRHLQQHVKLSIISTPVPDDKKDFNLLLLNDGQDMDQLRVKAITDSLYKKGSINPLIIVGIQITDREKYYGVVDQPDYEQRGSKANLYDAFINNELYPFIKKKAGVRKFNSVAIAGCSLGGLSALDIAWNHPDKIDLAGVFSGSFWWRDKDAAASDYSDDKNRIMLNKISTSRKKPHLKYWLYAGAKEEESDRDKDGIIDVVDDTRDLVTILKNKDISPSSDIVYTENPEGRHIQSDWSKALPAFLVWAFGK